LYGRLAVSCMGALSPRRSAARRSALYGGAAVICMGRAPGSDLYGRSPVNSMEALAPARSNGASHRLGQNSTHRCSEQG